MAQTDLAQTETGPRHAELGLSDDDVLNQDVAVAQPDRQRGHAHAVGDEPVRVRRDAAVQLARLDRVGRHCVARCCRSGTGFGPTPRRRIRRGLSVRRVIPQIEKRAAIAQTPGRNWLRLRA